jgi:two-component system, OmpR family, aerobic respiration control sensor histidine kinase ArcB
MSIKLLVVEDIPIARKMVQIILTQLGYQFDMAENGAEAIRLFKENHYDFVFMDLGLPDINGIEVTKELRKLEEGGNSVPIVALTAHHTEKDKERGLAVGMQEFLLKPLTKEIAQSTINKYVKK